MLPAHLGFGGNTVKLLLQLANHLFDPFFPLDDRLV